MTMVVTDDFALTPGEDGCAGTTHRSALQYRRQPTGVVLNGRWLEGAFRLSDGRHAVLTTDDVPYEPKLYFYLLDPKHRMMDHVEFGAAYTPGQVSHLRVLSPDRLAFSFFGAEQWTVTILTRSRRLLRLKPIPGMHGLNRLLTGQYLRVTHQRSSP